MFKKRFFSKKDIYKKIQKIRKNKGVSLRAISRETKIPIKHLRALEEGSINMLPDILYTKNIIKQYLSFFSIDPTPFITSLEIKRTEKQSPKKALKTGSLIIIPRIIKTGFSLILILGFIAYLGFSINKIFSPPSISISFPTEGEIVKTSIIAVIGETTKGTKIFINDEQVLLDRADKFNKEINLQKGLNLIKISGRNRYSKESVIWRNVILNIK